LLFVQGKKTGIKKLWRPKKIIIKGSIIKQTNTKTATKDVLFWQQESEQHLRSKDEEEEEEEEEGS
jgi:hypothetical protein